MVPNRTRREEAQEGSKSTRRVKSKTQPDWAAIRHAREVNGRRWSDLERDFGLTRQRIQRRAVREGWRQPGEVIQKATEDFARRFVARETEAILDAYRGTLDASRRILALATRRIESLEASPTEAEPSVLKDLAETVRKLHAIQADIGGLSRGDAWRPPAESTTADEEASSERIRAALARLCGDEPEGIVSNPLT